VITIISLLAAIAISQYSLYKQKATDAAMESTLQSARQAMEGYFVENDTYVGATTGNLPSRGYRATPNVTLNIGGLSDSAYMLLACSPGGTTPALNFDSSVGLMTANPGPCS
jgi:Tfp pilus assembly protein PilE